MKVTYNLYLTAGRSAVGGEVRVGSPSSVISSYSGDSNPE